MSFVAVRAPHRPEESTSLQGTGWGDFDVRVIPFVPKRDRPPMRRVRRHGAKRSEAVIRAGYEAAAEDTTFQSEAREVAADFDVAVADGLND